MKIEITARPEFHLPFTVEDVKLLRELAEAHYDGRCKAAGAPGGFLYGWNNRLTLVEGETYEGTPTVPATSDNIDITLKIIEMAGPYLGGNRRQAELDRIGSLNRALLSATDQWRHVAGDWRTSIETDPKPELSDVVMAFKMPYGWIITLKGKSPQKIEGHMSRDEAVAIARSGA